MKRKILKVGNASLAVSLPSKWAKPRNLKPGDEIDVSEQEGNLIINTSFHHIGKELEIICPPAEQFTRRIIVSPYMQGYDTIRIQYETPAQHIRINEILQHLIGFEIVNETGKEITIKNVSQGIEEEFKSIFHRTFHITNIMGETLIGALEKGDDEQLDMIKQYDTTSNKLNSFCKRILNTQPSGDIKNVSSTYQVVAEVEIVGDLFREIANYLKLLKKKPEILDEVRRTVALCRETFELYEKPTYERIVQQRHTSVKMGKEFKEKAAAGENDGYILAKLGEISHILREIAVEIQYPLVK